jgi:hypothetical protein
MKKYRSTSLYNAHIGDSLHHLHTDYTHNQRIVTDISKNGIISYINKITKVKYAIKPYDFCNWEILSEQTYHRKALKYFKTNKPHA